MRCHSEIRGPFRALVYGLFAVVAVLLGTQAVLLEVSGQAPREQFVVDHLSIRDGLPVNHGNTVYQTENGYLWIGTFGGLVRYDGKRFLTYSAGSTKGMPSDRVVAIFPGLGDTFWVVTEQFELVRVTPGHFDTVERFDSAVWEVFQESDSLAWIATGSGLFRYDTPSEGAANLTLEADPVIEGVAASNVHLDRNGALWISDGRNGDVFYRAPSGWVKAGRVQGGPSPGLLEHLGGFFEDRYGNLWLGGPHLSRVSPTGVEHEPVAGLPTGREFRIDGIFEGAPGQLVLLTTFGAFRVEHNQAYPVVPGPMMAESSSSHPNAYAVCSDGWLWTHRHGVIYRDDQPVASINGTLRQFLCDLEGNLWVVGDPGLYRIRKAVVQSYGTPEGLSVVRATSIFEDRSGGILITGNEGIYDWLKGGIVRSFPTGHGGSPFFEDSAGNLWMGSLRCVPENRASDGSCVSFTNQWPGGSPLWARAMHEDREGTLWFGLLSGLKWLRDDQWGTYPPEHALSRISVRYILEARNGTLYLATSGAGIARRLPPHAGGDGNFEFIDRSDGLSSDNVRGLYEDTDESIWIATEDQGLNRYEPSTGRVQVVRAADGLYSDALHQILADDYGRLWMSSNQGIFWVRAIELRAFVRGEIPIVTSVYYRERDGMRVREANGGWQNAAMRSRDGRLWFATQDGVAVIDPATINQNAAPSKVFVEEVGTQSGRVDLSGTSNVVLTAEERSFRIAYTAINFTSPARMRFRYRLMGYSEDWEEVGDRREATYTRVPAGDYEFQVAASPGDGTWSATPATLGVRIAPFFYERALFRVLGALGVLGLAALILQARTGSLKRRRSELEFQVAERTEALQLEQQRTEAQGQQLLKLDEMKTRFFTNVSHEFRTPLTLIIGPLEDLLLDATIPTSAGGRIEVALVNSRRILRLINQLLDVAQVEAGEMRLLAREQDLTSFVGGVAEQFAGLMKRKGIGYEVTLPVAPLPVYFQGEKMEQIVANLLSNALKFTPENGAVQVSLGEDRTTDPGIARIQVRDTGLGIPGDMLPHVFDRFYQVAETGLAPEGSSGIGLSLARDLAELHGGRITVESTQRFGSTFTVSLPLGRQHLADDQISDRVLPDRPWHPAVTESSRVEVPQRIEAGDGDDRFTVLVADDNADIRAYVRGHLAERYRVLEAANGRQALEIVRSCTPDLVVSDIMMPEFDGLELIAAMRAERETDFIPLIFLTAKASEDDLVRGLELGADAYLTKPFSNRELQVRIDALIASRQRLRQRFSDGGQEQAWSPVSLSPGAQVSASDAAFLARVDSAIAQGMSDEDFDIQALAEDLQVSRNTVHRRLKSLVHLTPTEYLRATRLNRACSLLATSEWSVGEVAYAVGFRSVSYFSRCFRDEYGLTPSEYAWQRTVAEAVPPEVRPVVGGTAGTS